MHVAIVTVGDELLAGDITDTNATWLAHRLDESGATVTRIVTVPDRRGAIAEAVRTAATRWDAVIVTGGLGPTHDDLTLEGVGAAFDREIVRHDEAAAALAEQGYDSADRLEGTADLPEGSRVLPNTEGVAPGAAIENVYVFPGVPSEMKAMFEAVADEFGGERRYVRTVAAAEPESALVDRLETVRDRFSVTVGSYPGESVRVKLQSTDRDAVDAAAEWLADRVEEPE